MDRDDDLTVCPTCGSAVEDIGFCTECGEVFVSAIDKNISRRGDGWRSVTAWD